MTAAISRPAKQPRALVLHLVSGAFLLLGALFVIAPDFGGRVYGLRTADPSALFYIRAIGFRDIALASFLSGLNRAGDLRALSIVATGTLIIPCGDLLLLLFSGVGQPVHYLLHGGSLLGFAALASWCRRAARRGGTPEPVMPLAAPEP